MPSTAPPSFRSPTVASVSLTEALAAPLIKAKRLEYEAKLNTQNEAIGRQQEERDHKGRFCNRAVSEARSGT
jgi:hypothetical protein